MAKECILQDRVCSNCGECNKCDLDENKICDNCGRCIDAGDAEYYEILIDDIQDTRDKN